MGRLYNGKCEYKQLSPLTLAFLGDCVFELFVREKLVCECDCSLAQLHKKTVKQVCCQAQAESLQKILSLLTEEELIIYRRGRNANTARIPKGATCEQYHQATGLECLFGYLYLCGEIQRLREIFSMIRFN